MASGKTTLGEGLAADGRFTYIDLDEAVEHSCGMPIAQIFAREGQEYFRQLEARLLRESAQPGCIVACGGGTPCYAGNMDFMLAKGLVVCLEASTDTIVRRLLEAAPGKRPLVDGYRHDPEALRRHITRMMDERRPYYDRAHARFDSNRLETDDEIESTSKLFKQQFLNPCPVPLRLKK